MKKIKVNLINFKKTEKIQLDKIKGGTTNPRDVQSGQATGKP